MIAAHTNARRHRGQNLKIAPTTTRTENTGDRTESKSQLPDHSQTASENGISANGAIISGVPDVSMAFEIGDIVAYSHMLDRPMQILEIHGESLRVKQLKSGAIITTAASLVVKVELEEEEEESKLELPTAEEIEAAIVQGSPKETIANLLGNTCFLLLEDVDSLTPDQEPFIQYRGWQLCTESPNGGMIALSICTPDGKWWSFPTSDSFGYFDHEQAIDWAKRLIDLLVEASEKASEQLSLLDPEPLSNESIEVCEKLIEGSSDDLQELELIIKKGLETFLEVGNALSEIRDRRLYLLQYKTFEEYCKKRWSLKQSRAYQLMDAAQTVENLKSSTIVELPKNEAQCRPIAKLPPEQQAAAWQEAVESAPNGRITAAHVQSVVEEKFSQVEDIALPKLQQLKEMFSQVGQIEDTRDGKGFAVLRPDLGNPFPLMFRNRQQAWDYWQAKRDVLLGLAGRKPMPESCDDFSPEAVAAVAVKQAFESRAVQALEVDRRCFVVIRSAVESFSTLSQLGWSKESIEDVAQQVIEFLQIVEV